MKAAFEKFVGDEFDREVMNYSLCDGCERRSADCPECRWKNSQRSIIELTEAQKLWESMQLIPNPNDPSKKVVYVSYPLDGDVHDLYGPAKSNSERYKKATKGLYQKLKNKKLLEKFHEQFVKSVREGHMECLTPEESKMLLASMPHCFSGVNCAHKHGSESHELRVVTNSSSVHQSGSFNSHCPKGLNLIGSLKNLFHKFRMELFCIMYDLSRAYRSLFTCPQTNNLRLMYWVVSILEAEVDLKTAIRVYGLVCLTYGDTPAACYLELSLRKIIAPQCHTQLGRDILGSDRYVDDVLTSHNQAGELFAAMTDMENTLEQNGTSIKKIISNGLSYHANLGLLNSDGSTSDGKFSGEDCEELAFNHRYNFLN